MGSSFGCDQGAPAAAETGTPVHVVWTYPANESTNVPLTFSIRVQFDRFLMSSTAVRGALCLQAATVGGESVGTDQCIAAGIAPQYDPVDRVASWVIRGQIMERTRYNVRIFAPKNAQDPNSVRAFDGAPLEKEFTFAFTTEKAPREPTPLEPPRTFGFCSAKRQCPLPEGACDGPSAVDVTTSPHDFLQRRCTSAAGCHADPPGTQGPTGSVLRLNDDGAGGGIAAAVRYLVDNAVVATETATGIDPVEPSRSVLAPFGRNMPYLDATNPGNSFLLYKLILAMAPRCPFDPNEESATHTASACTPEGGYAIGTFAEDFYDCAGIAEAGVPRDPSGSCPSDAGFSAPSTKKGRTGDLVPPLLDPLVPDDQWQPPARGEYDRLRTRIRGSGMPQYGLTTRQDALAISAWIADGARVESCP